MDIGGGEGIARPLFVRRNPSKVLGFALFSNRHFKLNEKHKGLVCLLKSLLILQIHTGQSHLSLLPSEARCII